MKKCFFSILVSVLMLVGLLPTAAWAANMSDVPQQIGAPVNVGIGVYPYVPEAGEIECFELGFSGDDSVRKFGQLIESGEFDELGLNSCNISVQIDYKYNETGDWHYTSTWDTEGAPFEAGVGSVFYSPDGSFAVNGWELDPIIENISVLEDNTIYFRLRFWLDYYNSNTGEPTTLISPWSDTVAYGKNAPSIEVNSVEAPILKNVELKNDDDGAPYFEVTAENPDSVKTLNNGGGSITVLFQTRKSGGEWVETGGSAGLLFEVYNEYPEDIGGMGEIDIEASTYEFRMRYGYSEIYAGTDKVYSPYSNVLTLGTPAYYKGASSWATAELDEAAVYGLIINRIKDNMAANVTREEFAEIAVNVYKIYYEGLSVEKEITGDASFTDTDNPQILEAANLGIVKGVGNNKFAPSNLVTREEMATMLLRVLCAVFPDQTFNADGTNKFTDDALIESWAQSGVYYCSNQGILNGIGNNMFNPDGNATRQEAVIVCKRAYEFMTDN